MGVKRHRRHGNSPLPEGYHIEKRLARLETDTWARPDSGFTLLFEALIMAFAPEMPVAQIAEHLGVHDTRLWRVIRHHVSEARKDLDITETVLHYTRRHLVCRR
ncbi:MAG: transposase family protein [Magnetococcales bacterium]|nr:transposase family protein [Magnetococcales bacterium]